MQFLLEMAPRTCQPALKEFGGPRSLRRAASSRLGRSFYAKKLANAAATSVSQEEDAAVISAYLHVLTGLFEVATRLFGIRINERQDVPRLAP